MPDGEGYGKSYYAPQKIFTSNKSWNPEAKRTYVELYNYYRPNDFYDQNGYFSPTYQQTYYDGYGYNFYYQNKGYYEFSRAPTMLKLVPFEVGEFCKVFFGMIFALIIYSFLYYKIQTKENLKED